MKKQHLEVGDITELILLSRKLVGVIWAWDRKKTCIKVIYRHNNSFTDEIMMPVEPGCKIWTCSKSVTQENFFGFYEYEILTDGKAKVLDQLAINTEEDLDTKISLEKAEFIRYAMKKLS